MVKATPILFKPHLVNKILQDTKTQTRRIVKPEPEQQHTLFKGEPELFHNEERMISPYGGPGDILWVRENFAFDAQVDDLAPRLVPEFCPIHYEAEGKNPPWAGKTRPNIFLPAWASRLTLEIIKVTPEKLNDITEEDAIAEGFENTARMVKVDNRADYLGTYAFEKFDESFRRINQIKDINADPWVWKIEFKKHLINYLEYMEKDNEI